MTDMGPITRVNGDNKAFDRELMLTAIQKIFFAISINYVKLQLREKINGNMNTRVSIFNYELQ